jgi:uncharacterized membrane protein
MIASHMLFGEAIPVERWMGALLIGLGIAFLSK